MIKLSMELAKRSRINQIYRLMGNGALQPAYFPRICARYRDIDIRPSAVKHFTTRIVLSAPASSSSSSSSSPPPPSQPKTDDNAVKEEIYAGPLSRRFHSLKLLTLATSLGTLFLLKDIHNRIEFPNQTVMVIGLGVVLLFSFLTPCLINLIAKKYCVKMYYDHSTKQYTAHIYTLLFKKKSIVFTPEDVVVPKVNKFFTVAYVKNYPMFFDANHFKTVDYYKNIMGYDKPIDFALDRKE